MFVFKRDIMLSNMEQKGFQTQSGDVIDKKRVQARIAAAQRGENPRTIAEDQVYYSNVAPRLPSDARIEDPRLSDERRVILQTPSQKEARNRARRIVERRRMQREDARKLEVLERYLEQYEDEYHQDNIRAQRLIGSLEAELRNKRLSEQDFLHQRGGLVSTRNRLLKLQSDLLEMTTLRHWLRFDDLKNNVYATIVSIDNAILYGEQKIHEFEMHHRRQALDEKWSLGRARYDLNEDEREEVKENLAYAAKWQAAAREAQQVRKAEEKKKERQGKWWYKAAMATASFLGIGR